MTAPTLPPQEINRKLIHLSSLWIPVAIYFLSTEKAMVLFGFLTTCVLLVEYARRKSSKISRMFDRTFRASLRPAETMYGGGMTGASYMMLGIFFCLFFPLEIAVTATTILVIADTAAAIVGIKFGKTRVLGKSLEGCAAFLLSGLAALIILGNIMPHNARYLASGTAAVIAATLAELCSKKLRLNDNFSIPVVICMVMWALR